MSQKNKTLNSCPELATYLRSGGISKYEFVANLPPSLTAKEFRKSVNIGEVMDKKLSVVFLTHGVVCELHDHEMVCLRDVQQLL